MKNSTTKTVNTNENLDAGAKSKFDQYPNLSLGDVVKRTAESAKNVSHNLGYMGSPMVNTELMLKKLLSISDYTPFQGKIAIIVENLEGKPKEIETYLNAKDRGIGENKLLIGNYLVTVKNYGNIVNETNTLVKGVIELDLF